MDNETFFDKDVSDVLFQFGTGELGLKSSEVRARRSKYGTNVLPKKKPDSIIKIFFREFIDAAVIAVIILVDAVMGAYQEKRANNTAAALENYIKVQVKVIRDSEEQIVGADELVPGDFVLL